MTLDHLHRHAQELELRAARLHRQARWEPSLQRRVTHRHATRAERRASKLRALAQGRRS